MSFVANFIRFQAMQNYWKSVKIWQSYRKFKGANFFETLYTASYLPYILCYVYSGNAGLPAEK